MKNGFARRLPHILTASALLLALLAGVAPQAYAASTELELAEQINHFDPGNGGPLTGQLTAVANTANHTVTVTGYSTGAKNPLSLNISGEIRVIWKATYGGWTTGGSQLDLQGDGIFEVAAGGNIFNYGPEDTITTTGAIVSVNGGVVEATLTGDAISVPASANPPSHVQVSSGTVSAYRGSAIRNDSVDTTVMISGGSVIADGYITGSSYTIRTKGSVLLSGSGKVRTTGTGDTINITDGSSIMVTGGEVLNTGLHGDAIGVYNGGSITVVGGKVGVTGSGAALLTNGDNSSVLVSGGTVSATTGKAILALGAGAKSLVNGGFVFAYGTGAIGDVIDATSGTITGVGVVCAWNRAAGVTTYASGTSTHLVASSPAASVRWAKSGGLSGIVYQYGGSGTGFFPVDGVTVTATASMGNFSKVNSYLPGVTYTDVDEDAWYGANKQKMVALAYEYNLMKGTSSGKFSPTNSLSIAETVALAAKVHDIYTGGLGEFMQGDPWYTVYIDYAKANGIIGISEFPNLTKKANRAEMAYIFSRCLPSAEFKAQNTVNNLPDVTSKTPYYSAIFALYRAGVLTGSNAQGKYNPASSITRAEAAGIISRVILPGTRASGRIYG